MGDKQILWTRDDVAQALSCSLPEKKIVISGVSIDSRSVAKGDIFFAIKGDRLDGHDFVEKAFENKAAYCVISAVEKYRFQNYLDRLFIVEDVLAAMESLGRAARHRLSGQAIAVTGSVGKTGTKEMLRLAFSKSGKVHASIASFNNHWGVPLTLSRTLEKTDFGIYEVGMNHAGEIETLVDMIKPDIAIITTVEPVHLEFFDSEQDIARAKAEIFKGVSPQGYVILNYDNRHYDLLVTLAKEEGIKTVSFGEHKDADIRLLSVDLAEKYSDVQVSVYGIVTSYRLGMAGRHIVQNSLAVAACLYLAKADVERGLLALREMKAPEGRGQRHDLSLKGGKALLLDESYNANPASMRAAIELLSTARIGAGGRRIAVLGDMLELGDESDELHAALLDALVAHEIDSVFLSGPHMKALWIKLPEKMRGQYATSSDGLAKPLLDTVAKGDALMVKGSLGSKMRPLVDKLLETYKPKEN